MSVLLPRFAAKQRDVAFSRPSLINGRVPRFPQVAKVFMGEGTGLIYSVDAAEKITRDVAREAEDQLDNINRLRT